MNVFSSPTLGEGGGGGKVYVWWTNVFYCPLIQRIHNKCCSWHASVRSLLSQIFHCPSSTIPFHSTSFGEPTNPFRKNPCGDIFLVRQIGSSVKPSVLSATFSKCLLYEVATRERYARSSAIKSKNLLHHDYNNLCLLCMLHGHKINATRCPLNVLTWWLPVAPTLAQSRAEASSLRYVISRVQHPACSRARRGGNLRFASEHMAWLDSRGLFLFLFFCLSGHSLQRKKKNRCHPGNSEDLHLFNKSRVQNWPKPKNSKVRNTHCHTR